MQMHLLRPGVIVEYERSAFVYDTGNIRITFDRNISYSHQFDSFLEDEIPKTPLLPANQHVFEVKYDGILPEFIAQTIETGDRKSTRLNSSHVSISYAVFCLKKKKNTLY